MIRLINVIIPQCRPGSFFAKTKKSLPTFRANGVRARVDVMASKLGIILLLLPSFLFFFLSFHVLPNLRAAKGPEQSGGTQPKHLSFWLALAGGVRALWVSEQSPRWTHINSIVITKFTYCNIRYN